MLIKEGRLGFNKGCLMASLNNLLGWNQFEKFIDSNDLYTSMDDDYGFEQTPHITILWGFDLKTTDPEDFMPLQKLKAFDIKFKGLSLFENEKYDVLKFDVESPILEKLNKWCCKNFDFENDYDEFIPHCTVGYFLPGYAKKYINRFKVKPFSIRCDVLSYSRRTKGHETSIFLSN